jgi:hypothetical protein
MIAVLSLKFSAKVLLVLCRHYSLATWTTEVNGWSWRAFQGLTVTTVCCCQCEGSNLKFGWFDSPLSECHSSWASWIYWQYMSSTTENTREWVKLMSQVSELLFCWICIWSPSEVFIKSNQLSLKCVKNKSDTSGLLGLLFGNEERHWSLKQDK